MPESAPDSAPDPAPPPRYPRDFRGHGPTPPDAAWPGGAKIAVSLVLNYEEGGENNILHGDAASEAFLSDIPGAAPWPGQRHWNMESLYDYGARAGFWRLHRLFTGLSLPVTVYGVTSALARNPEQVAAMKAAGWEIASHGLKWIDHRDLPAAEEAAQIAESFRLHAEVVGTPPQGWYTGRCSMNTVRLAAETGRLAWISDAYDDDLPYWRAYGDHHQLVIPYTLEANDMRFATAPGYITGDQFFGYLKDSFDTLYAEGQAGAAKMFSIGLHCRLIGRPGKIAGLGRFLDYALSYPGVWFPRRFEIAGPFESDDGDVLTGWALDGRGIVLKPRFEVAEHLRRGALVPVAAATPPLPVQLSTLSQHRRLKDPKVQLFAEFMAAQIKDDLRRAA
jgi:chitin deacetylase